MIGLCSRCGAGFDGSEEDVNNPGDDLQGPECPACYRRRKSMGIKDGVAPIHATQAPVSPSLKAAPTPGDVAVAGVPFTAAALPLVSSQAYDLAVLLVMTVPFMVVGLWAWWEEFRNRRTDALMRRGFREAKRRGWLPEDDTQ